MADNLIADHLKGATWDGFSFIAEEETEPNSGVYEPVNLSGIRILAEFKKEPTGTVVFKFDTDDDTITLPEPAGNEFIFMPRVMNVPAYTYVFDIKFITSVGVIDYTDLEYWRIIQTVTG